MSSTLGKKQYLLLGKLLVMRHPDVAEQLLIQIAPGDPPERDLSRIPVLYNSFCMVVNVDPLKLRGPLRQTTKVDVRRLFISVILHLYSPQVYNQPSDGIIIRHGLVQAVSSLLYVNSAYMSRFIRQTILMEKVYEEYRAKVTQTREELISNTNTYAS